MDYDALLKHYGSLSGICAACGQSKTTVHNWKSRGVPHAWQLFFSLLIAKSSGRRTEKSAA